MKQKKHLFIINGIGGIIWYSWIFILLFLTIILCFESVNGFNWWPVATGTLFILGIIYSVFNTYYVVLPNNKTHVKLPFLKAFKSNEINITAEFKYFCFGEFRRESYESIKVLFITNLRKGAKKQ